MTAKPEAAPRRARDLGIAPGPFTPRLLNAITDVAGVLVGQVTLHAGADVRTGVTAVLPHAGNVFQDKVPAGLAVANGYGKFIGATQIEELGEIETPVILTNTLAAPRAADALIDWTLRQPGNERVRSVNPVVGETNDGVLNAIRRRAITDEHVLRALDTADDGPVAEGAVGAGTGTIAFGWKGGVGTSSRQVPVADAIYMIGVLVQANYGGRLVIDGVGFESGARDPDRPAGPPATADGSIVIVIATDAPLSDRNLKRLASRAFAGLARTGSAFSNGSGDYALAFSTADGVRRTPARRRALSSSQELPNERLSPLFAAVADATEEAILNALFQAVTVESVDEVTGAPVLVRALGCDTVAAVLAARNAR
jgi:D-aminopeptidase